MTIEQLYDIYLRHPSIRTDTRKLRQGDLFFALKGPNFNGNQFAAKALEMGAAYAVIDEMPAQAVELHDQTLMIPNDGPTAADLVPPYHSDRLLFVEDVLTALQELALHHRRQFDIPFIAITGSNGKTTTKELVSAVLAARYKTYTTTGNLNNHIGVPLTILSVEKDAQFAVIEMGANHQKEIEGYCRYTLPTHGIITNAGLAHLEGFGGPEGVKKGKGELYDFLRANNGTAFVMSDYDYLRAMSRGIPHIITYGTHDADITGTVAAASSSFLDVRTSIGDIHTQLVGDYNLPNVLVAVAVGLHFGVPDASIKNAIESYAPSNSRSQLLEKDGNHIILDAYNANPSSMRAAIENFARIPAANPGGSPFSGGAPITSSDSPITSSGSPISPSGISPSSSSPDPGAIPPKKILILGAMAELGPQSLAEHQAIVDLIGQYPWQQVILVGGDFQRIDHPYRRFDTSGEAAAWFRRAGITGAYILIKGSRSSKMEEVITPTR